ncbi:MAG TPA: MmcQ/YjbR family DNA-binding protein [Planctomycetota bacterium]
MTPDAFRRLALALPEAHEAPHFERTSFRVGKKIFATLVPDGGEAMIKLPVAEEAEDWIAARPELFFSYGTWTTRNGALGVRLARAPAKLLQPLLVEAWRAIAPKRALAAFDGGAGGRSAR